MWHASFGLKCIGWTFCCYTVTNSLVVKKIQKLDQENWKDLLYKFIQTLGLDTQGFSENKIA